MIIPSQFIKFVYDNNLTGLGWIDLVDLSLDYNGKFTKFGVFLFSLFAISVAYNIKKFLNEVINHG